jgi:Ca-activated chloride channel family protein
MLCMRARHLFRHSTRLALLLSILLPCCLCYAQQPAEPAPPPPPPEPPPEVVPGGYTIQRDVNLVLLRVSVNDAQGQFVPGLKAQNFRLFEDGAEQKIDVLRQEDAPVSIGLLIDNSGSMRDKRPNVNVAALTFVRTSNPDDEDFVAHFNEAYSFDLDKPFTNNLGELGKALEQTESRGSTALYDAILTSMDRLKSGYNSKKVLLIVTDGEDNSSHNDLAATLDRLKHSNVMVYAVGLFSDEEPKAAETARQALTAITQATGGAAYFPQSSQEVADICTHIAYDIRHQYSVGYYPSKPADKSFRTVHVDVAPPAGMGTVTVRTRAGYFASRTD